MVDALFSRPVVDLGDRNPQWRGIWSPEYDEETVARYLTDQFRERADEYVRTHHNTDRSFRLLEAAFRRAVVDLAGPAVILDLGSGSGTTITPLLNLFTHPATRIVATDLSLEMLLLCRHLVASHPKADRCEFLQLNAEEMEFRPGSLDVVVGSAILHHLLEPEKAIAGAARALRPGGVAVFFEPFEAGFMLERLIYEAILADPRRDQLPAALVEFWGNRARALLAQRGTDRDPASRQHLDDKWLFTRSFLERAADAAGFRRLSVTPLDPGLGAIYRGKINWIIETYHGTSLDNLPEWVRDVVHRFDGAFSTDCKEGLLMEGCITFWK